LKQRQTGVMIILIRNFGEMNTRSGLGTYHYLTRHQIHFTGTYSFMIVLSVGGGGGTVDGQSTSSPWYRALHWGP
jgi:hypothetical protein